MVDEQWIYCPMCGNKTRIKVRCDTELKNFPLFCPKCKQENLINAKDFQAKRGLLMMVGKRKRMLVYLRKNNLEGYRKLVKDLNLRG